MRINTTFLGLLLSITATAQLHIDYLSQLHYVQPLSDVWGYTAPDSSEYALVGTFTGTSIVNISDPENPEEVQFVQGAISTWYDIKTWQHYAYVVNETAGGLLIIDLSDLPNSIDTTSWRGMGLATAHNIFIDENGFAYVLGANVQNGGAIIIDLNDNPWEPEFAGIYDEGYIHDAFVRGDTMWASEIHNGLLTVVDVSNKASPLLMASTITAGEFTHNCWLTDDGQTIYTTDEIDNGFVVAYDVSDIDDIEELDRYQSTPGSDNIPHNTFVKGDYLYTSYYRDGVTIVDAANPENLVEVGNFDTSPLPPAGSTSGNWGVYPYFPSGNIVATDVNEGLFVLRPELVRACYLEGTITRDIDGLPSPNATVEIMGNGTFERTNIAGEYKTGAADSGSYNIRITAPGCYSQIIPDVLLDNGVVTELNVMLTCSTVVANNEIKPEAIFFEAHPTVFENPTTLYYNLNSISQSAEVHLLNSAGELLQTHILHSKKGKLNLNIEEPAGIYFVRLVDGKQAATIKLVKL